MEGIYRPMGSAGEGERDKKSETLQGQFNLMGDQTEFRVCQEKKLEKKLLKQTFTTSARLYPQRTEFTNVPYRLLKTELLNQIQKTFATSVQLQP